MSGLRILIVDDDPGIREGVASMLSDRGAVVWKAGSAAEARGIFVGFEPHLLVSDIAMPDEDGLSLIRGIRAQGSTIPALALSGMTSSADRSAALAAGFDVHMAKPVSSEQLAATIMQVIREVPPRIPA